MQRLLPVLIAVVFLVAVQRERGARAGAAAQAPSLEPGSYALNVADGTSARLGGPDSTAVLSPDGALAAVVTREGPEPGLRVVDLATGEATTPLVSDQGQVADPAWSPDGRLLAFRFSRFGRPDPAAVPPEGLYIVAPRTRETVAVLRDLSVIWTWGPDSGSITGITFAGDKAGLRAGIAIMDAVRGAVLQTVLPPSASICPTALAWSADGRRLVFQGGAFRQGCGEASALGLWLWEVDGDKPRQLTRGALYVGPSWTADGRILARRIGGFDPETRGRQPDTIVLVDEAGGEVALATTPGTPFPFVPQQQTVGRTVMFWQAGCEEAAVWVVNVDGGQPRRLTEPGELALQPTLSPDGGSVAWVAHGAAMGALRLAAVDGGGVRTRATAAPSLDLTGWSGDGRRLSFTAGTWALRCPGP